MGVRESISRAKDINEELVHVDEWNCPVLLVGISGAERGEMDRYIRMVQKEKGDDANFLETYVWPLLQLTMREPETKERVFALTAEDRDFLLAKNDSVLMALFLKAQVVCGVASSSREEAKADLPETP